MWRSRIKTPTTSPSSSWASQPKYSPTLPLFTKLMFMIWETTKTKTYSSGCWESMRTHFCFINCRTTPQSPTPSTSESSSTTKTAASWSVTSRMIPSSKNSSNRSLHLKALDRLTPSTSINRIDKIQTTTMTRKNSWQSLRDAIYHFTFSHTILKWRSSCTRR